MTTHLSRFFEQQRLSQGLRPGQLAQRIECKNLAKNGSRIREFELTGSISKALFEKLVHYFGVDVEEIERLMELDRRDFFARWLAWVNEPIQPYLVVRMVAAVYVRRELEPGVQTIEEAEQWAASVASEMNRKCCLVWSRRLSVWFNENGQMSARTEAAPGEPNMPWMGKNSRKYVLDANKTSKSDVSWLKKPNVGSLEN